MKIGIIREGKTPHDDRTPLTPAHCVQLIQRGFDVIVQPNPLRCFSDDEYLQAGIKVQEDISDREILLGVKEVPIDLLIPGKIYFFFSHTIKKQPHNRKLLKAILQKKITLLDYEVLTTKQGMRLIAFGVYAGMVGAHNALYTFGHRTGAFDLPRMVDIHDYEKAKEIYKSLVIPPVRIVLTGTGRVSGGSAQVLRDMGIRQVEPEDYLRNSYEEAVFTQIDSDHYVDKNDDSPHDRADFHAHPEQYHSIFAPYFSRTDILINGIYWDNRAPQFFTLDEMKRPEFRIQVIADVTCDIAPASSIPSTIRASTIADPIYGFDPQTGFETDAFRPDAIDIMAIDNLPNEMARDASMGFGDQFMLSIEPELEHFHDSDIIRRGTIAAFGKLTQGFAYLQDYVDQE